MPAPALERRAAQTIFSTPLITIGRFEAGPEDPLFQEVSPPGHHFAAFPETELAITYERAGQFVIDPTRVTFYNPADSYARRPISREGDRCTWVSAPPEVLEELVLSTGGGAARGERIFEVPVVRCPARLFVEQRRLLQRTVESGVDLLEVEESWMNLLAEVLAGRGSESGGVARRPSPATRRSVAAAQELLAARFREPLSLGEIASASGCSPFHLSRAFRSRTGLSIHRYKTSLRLRHGFDELLSGRECITDLALDLGFSSHSHFTSSFRRAFGRTPRAVRESRRLH